MFFLLFLSNKLSYQKYILFKEIYSAKIPVSVRRTTDLLNCHTDTIKKIVCDLNKDLGQVTIQQNSSFFQTVNTFSMDPFEYYTFLTVNDLPYKIFDEIILKGNKHTLFSLSEKLFISRSKLYFEIKRINNEFISTNIRLKIDIDRWLIIVGEQSDVLNLLFELLLKKNELTEQTNPFFEKTASSILKSMGMGMKTLDKPHQQAWLEAFVFLKKIKHSSIISLKSSMFEKCDLNVILENKQFCLYADKLNDYFFKSPMEAIDYTLLFISLFNSLSSIKDKNLSTQIFLMHKRILGQVIPHNKFKDIENELLCFFEELSSENVKPVLDFSKGIQAVVYNYPIFKLRYCEAFNSQVINKCPIEIRREIEILPSFISLCKYLECTKCENNILIEAFWFLFRTSKGATKMKLHNKKIVFKSIFGEKQEEVMKSKVLNEAFTTSLKKEGMSEVLYVVDDDRLLKNDSSISIDLFLEHIQTMW